MVVFIVFMLMKYSLYKNNTRKRVFSGVIFKVRVEVIAQYMPPSFFRMPA